MSPDHYASHLSTAFLDRRQSEGERVGAQGDQLVAIRDAITKATGQ